MTCSIRFFGQDYSNPRVKDFDTCELAFEVSKTINSTREKNLRINIKSSQ